MMITSLSKFKILVQRYGVSLEYARKLVGLLKT